MPATAATREIRAIGLIGIAHALSHFYQFVLPPLFLILHRELGYSYVELGLLTTVFYTASGLCQPPVGFLVDRFGARPMLYGGLALLAGATALYGVYASYPALLALSVIAGIGNSVFHPADFSILGATVVERRMGRAFGFHAFAGLMGYAVTPVTILFLADALGWRGAVAAAGIFGLFFLAVMAALGRDFSDSAAARDRTQPAFSPRADAQLLLSLPSLMFLTFFVALAMTQIGIQTFNPAALQALHGLSDLAATGTMNAFVAGLPVGVLVGGALAERTKRHDHLAITCMAVPGLFLPMAGLTDFGDGARIVMYFLSGLAFGAVFPARDMLVRKLAPRGASGKVFGFVYSGLDIGSALTPVAFGWLLDIGMPVLLFAAIALCQGIAILTIAAAARSGGQRVMAP